MRYWCMVIPCAAAAPKTRSSALYSALIGVRGVPGLVAIHVPNGGVQEAGRRQILKGLGVTPACPTSLLWHDGNVLRDGTQCDTGRVSEAQSDMLTRLSEAGVVIAVCHGIDQAVACLESWQLLKGGFNSLLQHVRIESRPDEQNHRHYAPDETRCR